MGEKRSKGSMRAIITKTAGKEWKNTGFSCSQQDQMERFWVGRIGGTGKGRLV